MLMSEDRRRRVSPLKEKANSPLVCVFVPLRPSDWRMMAPHTGEGDLLSVCRSQAKLFWKRPHRHTLK